MMVIPLQLQVKLNQIASFTMYTMQKQQTQLILNWYLISGEGDCGEGDCGEGEWITLPVCLLVWCVVDI